MSLSEDVEIAGHKKIFGIPEDIAMVLAIDLWGLFCFGMAM